MAVIPPGDERIPASRVPLSDIETIAGKPKGIITKEWFRYLQAVFRLVLQGGNTTSIQDLLIAPGSAGTAGAHVAAYAYGSFRSAQTQYVGIADEAYPVEFTEEVAANGVLLDPQVSEFLASSVTTTLTVSSVTSGTLYPGVVVSGSLVAPSTRIVRQISGVVGGAGDYEIDVSQTLSSRQMFGLTNSTLRIYRTGVYSVQVLAMLINTDIVDQQVDMWLRVNGDDVVGSNTKVSGYPNDGAIDGYTPISACFGVQLNMGDLMEIMWSTSDVAAALVPIAAQVSPDRPYTPSVTATISMISVPTLQSAAA